MFKMDTISSSLKDNPKGCTFNTLVYTNEPPPSSHGDQEQALHWVDVGERSLVELRAPFLLPLKDITRDPEPFHLHLHVEESKSKANGADPQPRRQHQRF